jgi:hypothetical protein
LSLYAIMLADTAYDLLVAEFGARFKTYRKTPMMQVNPGDLPMLGVYILREQGAAIGNANHTEPRFQNTLTLGVSGAIHADTDDQNKFYLLEQAMAEVADTLLSNPRFVKLTEGFPSADRTSQYAKVGETTLFEIRVELQVAYASWFPPRVVDDFNTMHVTTAYPPGVDPDTVMQIIRIYEINENAKSKAGRPNGGDAPHHP